MPRAPKPIFTRSAGGHLALVRREFAPSGCTAGAAVPCACARQSELSGKEAARTSLAMAPSKNTSDATRRKAERDAPRKVPENLVDFLSY